MKTDKPSQPPSSTSVSDATGPDGEQKPQKKVTDAARKPGKIAAIKAALAKGTFSVDDEVVADTIIGHTRKALRKPSRTH